MRALLDGSATQRNATQRTDALLDADHLLHDRATTWYGSHARSGWVSCPITENGCVRVMSHPGYPNALPVRAVVERLVEPRAGGFHEFWPDRISLLDGKVADSARIHGPRQITDVYLRALTVPHGDRFVTSDTAVSRDAVVGVERCRVVVL
jgi:predicted nucleic acid-binding protein